jgi:hypothetical protein
MHAILKDRAISCRQQATRDSGALWYIRKDHVAARFSALPFQIDESRAPKCIIGVLAPKSNNFKIAARAFTRVPADIQHVSIIEPASSITHGDA